MHPRPASDRSDAEQDGDYDLLEVPLETALGHLRESAQVNLFVNRRSLEVRGVTTDSPVSLHLKGVPHRTALKLMLGNADGSLFSYLVDGTVVVAAKNDQPAMFGGPVLAPRRSPGRVVHRACRQFASRLGIRESCGRGSAVLQASLTAAERNCRSSRPCSKRGRQRTASCSMPNRRSTSPKRKSPARRELDLRAKLLNLDRSKMELQLLIAQKEFSRLQELNLKEAGTISSEQLSEKETAVKQAQLELDRITALSNR